MKTDIYIYIYICTLVCISKTIQAMAGKKHMGEMPDASPPSLITSFTSTTWARLLCRGSEMAIRETFRKDASLHTVSDLYLSEG